MAEASRGQPPAGTEYYVERGGQGLLVKKAVVLTGERIYNTASGVLRPARSMRASSRMRAASLP